MTSFTIGGKGSAAEIIEHTSAPATSDIEGQDFAKRNGAPSDCGNSVPAHLSKLADLPTVDRNASSPMSERRAIQVITAAFRKSISIKPERHMLENGALWKKWSPDT